VIDAASLAHVNALAMSSSVVDYALYAGGTASNAVDVAAIARQCAGLKLYLNDTFTTLRMDNMSDWLRHFEEWPSDWCARGLRRTHRHHAGRSCATRRVGRRWP